VSRIRSWLCVAVCLLMTTERAPAKASITEEPVAPTLMNASFEDAGATSDRVAGWGRWGDWFNREEGWVPVRSGRCILGYHHWEIQSANDSGIYQDITNAVKGVEYTFGIFASVDKAQPPRHDALSVELRLECLVDGKPQQVASKLCPVADLTPDQWEKLTVSGTPVNALLRVLVVVRPSPAEGNRGGAVRFDDAFLAPSPSVDSAIPKISKQTLNNRTDFKPCGNAVVIRDISYARIHPHQNLDLYLPDGDVPKSRVLVVRIHSGEWMLRGRDWNNVKYPVKHGYALVSGEDSFPAQIRDCNAALN
jgi:hypothetical protein